MRPRIVCFNVTSFFLVLCWLANYLCLTNMSFAVEKNNMDTSAISLLQRCLVSQEAADRVIYHLSEERIHEIHQKTHSEKTSAWFYRDGDRLKFDATYTDVSGKMMHFVEVITSEMQVRYHWVPPQKAPTQGAINKATRMQAFAERCGELDGYDPIIRPLKRIAAFLQDSPNLRISGEKMIGEALCKVITAKTPYGEYSLWLAEGMGCLPLRMTRKVGPKDKNGYNNVDKPYEEVDKDLFSIDLTIDNVVIRKFDNVFFPVSGKKTVIERSKNMEIKDVYNISRDKIQINPQFKDGAFSIDLPNGTRVLDHDRSGVLYESRDGAVVPAHSDFAAQAESNWPDRSPWLLIISWFVSGLALLATAIFVIRKYKKKGEAI